MGLSPWEVLQIPPTSGETEVRRAYAKRLKASRPEDDPEAFQALREAYNSALANCRIRANRQKPQAVSGTSSQIPSDARIVAEYEWREKSPNDEREEEAPDETAPANDEREEEAPDETIPAVDEQEEEAPDEIAPVDDEREEEAPDETAPANDEQEEEVPDETIPANDEQEEEVPDEVIPADDEQEEEVPDEVVPHEESMDIPMSKPMYTADGFLKAFRELAEDYRSYPDRTRWLTLLNSASELTYWDFEQTRQEMVYVLPKFPFLPSFVWTRMEELFDWERERDRLDNRIIDIELNRLKRMGEAARWMRSKYFPFHPNGPICVSIFRNIYDKTHDKNKDFYALWKRLCEDSCKSVGAKRAHREMLYLVGSWKELCTSDGDKNNTYIQIRCAEALRRTGNYQMALAIYEDILREISYETKALRWSAFCLERLGRGREALERYRQVLKESPGDVYSACAASRLEQFLAGKRSSFKPPKKAKDRLIDIFWIICTLLPLVVMLIALLIQLFGL